MGPVEIGVVDEIAVRGGATAFPALHIANEEALRLIGAGAGRSAEQLRSIAAGVAQSLGVTHRAWAHVPGTKLDPAHEESTLELAVAAGRGALEDAGVAASELALVLCATSTPHKAGATVAAGVGHVLATRAACLDIRGGCAAAMFGLATAALHVAAGCGPVLLVAAETFSRVLPPANQVAALALADGAAAIVLARGRGRLRAAAFATDGTLAHLVPDGAAPDLQDLALAAGAYFLSADPGELLDEVPRRYEAALAAVLRRGRLAAKDVDLLVAQQASRQLIADVCQRAGIPERRAYVNLDRHGNVGAASWLIALVEARAKGYAHPGSRVALAAVGGGMSWAAAVLEL
jgi:3-oxoacyl-[acyl-carrier-protein] synthase III